MRRIHLALLGCALMAGCASGKALVGVSAHGGGQGTWTQDVAVRVGTDEVRVWQANLAGQGDVVITTDAPYVTATGDWHVLPSTTLAPGTEYTVAPSGNRVLAGPGAAPPCGPQPAAPPPQQAVQAGPCGPFAAPPPPCTPQTAKAAPAPCTPTYRPPCGGAEFNRPYNPNDPRVIAPGTGYPCAPKRLSAQPGCPTGLMAIISGLVDLFLWPARALAGQA